MRFLGFAVCALAVATSAACGSDSDASNPDVDATVDSASDATSDSALVDSTRDAVADDGAQEARVDAGCTSAASCDDGNACTTDTCDESGNCHHTAISGCCNHDVDCASGDVCSVDTCTFATHTCNHAHVTDCCTSPTDPCDDGSPCTKDACDVAAHKCTHTPISGCCTKPDDPACVGTSPCDTYTCVLPAGTCSSTPIAGCCVGAADCDDKNPCTTDSCNASHACVHTPFSGGGCCVTLADCDDGNACTADACSATFACTHTPISGGGCCAAVADCADSNPCTDKSCSATFHCAFTDNTAPCAGGGTCSGGVCVPPPPTCADYCTTITANCIDSNAQYSDVAHCTNSCAAFGWATGVSTDTTGNTLGCRLDHARAAATAPVTECPKAGPLGFGACGTSICNDFCAADIAVCGASAYADMPTCLTDCAGYSDAASPNLSSPTGQLACRTYHLTNAAAPGSAATHCPHTSLSGGGVCP